MKPFSPIPTGIFVSGPLLHARDSRIADLHIRECPTVDEALPDFPKKGRWIQTGNRSGTNPCFSADVPECGKEITP